MHVNHLPKGLDAVEIALRTEELFVVTIEDDEAAIVRAVEHFYNLVCRKVKVVPKLALFPDEKPRP